MLHFCDRKTVSFLWTGIPTVNGAGVFCLASVLLVIKEKDTQHTEVSHGPRNSLCAPKRMIPSRDPLCPEVRTHMLSARSD